VPGVELQLHDGASSSHVLSCDSVFYSSSFLLSYAQQIQRSSHRQWKSFFILKGTFLRAVSLWNKVRRQLVWWTVTAKFCFCLLQYMKRPTRSSRNSSKTTLSTFSLLVPLCVCFSQTNSANDESPFPSHLNLDCFITAGLTPGS